MDGEAMLGAAGVKVRQVLARAARGDHRQRCELFQAPPQGGTQGHDGRARAGTAGDVDLQSHRPARDLAGLQPALPGVSSSLDDPSAGERDLQRLSQPRVGTDPSIKGLNFFSSGDQALLRTLQHGEFNFHEPISWLGCP